MAATWAGTGKGSGMQEWKPGLGGSGEMVREPPPSGSAEPSTQAIAQFPIVGQVPPPDRVAELLKQHQTENAGRLAPNQYVEAYQLAIPVSWCDPANPRDCSQPAEYEALWGKVRAEREALHQIDLVFVIDKTRSMEAYWPATSEAVNKFVARFEGQLGSSLDINLGAATYGDYTAEGPGTDRAHLDYDVLVPLTPARQALTLFARLSRQKFYPDVNKDYPEASLAALIRASQTLPGPADQQNNFKWRPTAGIRMGVHRGDHGGRRKGFSSGENGSQLVEIYDATDVAAAFAEKRIGYLGIAVRGADYQPHHNAKFVEDARAVVDAQNQHNRLTHPGEPLIPTSNEALQITYNTDSGAENSDAVVGTISAAIERAFQTSAAADQAIARAIDCSKTHQPCATVNVKVGPPLAVFAQASAESIVTEEVQRAARRHLKVAPYWVAPLTPDGKQQVLKYSVAMDESAVYSLSDALGKSCAYFTLSSRQPQHDLWRFWGEVESGDNESATDDIAKKRLGIPGYFLNAHLSKNWNDLEDDIETAQRAPDPALDALRQAMCRSSKQMEALTANARYKPGSLTWDLVAGYFKAGTDPEHYEWT